MTAGTAAIAGTAAGDDKRYARIRLAVSLAGMALDLAVLLVFAFSGLSRLLAGGIAVLVPHVYLQFFILIALMGAAAGAAGFPLDLYGGFIVEHRFGLSHQRLSRWLWERVKALAVSAAVGLPLSAAFFFFLRVTGDLWWLWFGILAVAVAVGLARIAPSVILPLFYKYRRIEEGEVAERLAALLKSLGIAFRGIYSFNMSRDTRKANAGFAGFGRGKRIVLSDTLISEFTPGEIAVIFAHELGHYRKRHLLANLLVSGALILISFYLCGLAYGATCDAMGFAELHEIAAIPVLLSYLSLVGLLTMPLTNMVSRRQERQADRYALEVTGDAASFVSAMERLAVINLSDPDPHPAVEFLFHAHPSIKKRIRSAREWGG
ncbi:MAG: M48 family metallopeptidase [Spirochaetes bacterium]|nr:M48 family metallopeptidase [Spirochaetota bacterium]